MKDLGKRVMEDEQISSRFRMQRINDFYYGWSATAADINHDGILDIVSGPFYYLGPDYKVSREIYFSKTSDVSSQLTSAMVNFWARTTTQATAGPDVPDDSRHGRSNGALCQPERRTAPLG